MGRELQLAPVLPPCQPAHTVARVEPDAQRHHVVSVRIGERGQRCAACSSHREKVIEWPVPDATGHTTSRKWYLCRDCGLIRMPSALETQTLGNEPMQALEKAMLRDYVQPWLEARGGKSFAVVHPSMKECTLQLNGPCGDYHVVPNTGRLGDTRYDAIVHLFSLERERDPQQAIEVTRESLRRGGSILMCHYDASIYRLLLQGPSWSGFNLPGQLYSFEAKHVDLWLEQAGVLKKGQFALPGLLKTAFQWNQVRHACARNVRVSSRFSEVLQAVLPAAFPWRPLFYSLALVEASI